MPGVLPSDGSAPPRGSPSRKNRLSLKLFQKKEAKRALDFTEPPENEQKGAELRGAEMYVGVRVLPEPRYLAAAPRVGIPLLGKRRNGPIIARCGGEVNLDFVRMCGEDPPLLLWLSCPNLSLQPCFLVKISSSLVLYSFTFNRELNPMYEGYLQHDAQEVLQCILGNIQETCQLLKKEELNKLPLEEPKAKVEEKIRHNSESNGAGNSAEEEENMPSSLVGEVAEDKLLKGYGKRKSDAEGGNAKKKSKVSKEQIAAEENQRQTRSKRKATGDKLENPTDPVAKCSTENESAKPTQKKSRLKLNWLKSSCKQPSILSKFYSLGKLTTNLGSKDPVKEYGDCELEESSAKCENGNDIKEDGHEPASPVEMIWHILSLGTELAVFELVEKLFQGQLVLRTRCLECECFTERREDFQDISVPVQEDELSKTEESSEISPEPKTEMKTLKWAISQFASVERIVGEDKYFCENCHHYTEAERSLLFDKMPEVITIHLKCFAASGLE
uniref:USP domain-containing protein n=1 Tax=Pavo cristatus TaxID=9049 RepID=A0A8C9FUK7_PAVCR